MIFMRAGGVTSSRAHQRSAWQVPNRAIQTKCFPGRHCRSWPPGLFAVPSLAAEPAGAPVADFTLANGLELVVVIPDHRAPVVTHMIWYKVGAADETPGKVGAWRISSNI